MSYAISIRYLELYYVVEVAAFWRTFTTEVRAVLKS